jgi:cell shape-determining protein MreC
VETNDAQVAHDTEVADARILELQNKQLILKQRQIEALEKQNELLEHQLNSTKAEGI